jgi:NAD(P)-dependent dehydrogenase (short-subunit alcohol dehydrogenase family)
MDIKNKVVIVTGASSGIGLAAAELFARKGAKLVLAARSKDTLDKLASEMPDAVAVQTDMTKADSVKAMVAGGFRHFGRIDVLVNNAGQGYDSAVEDIESEKLQHIFNLTIIGPVTAMQQVIPIMRRQGGGAIVNISSGLAKMDLPSLSPYASIKAAIAKISLAARQELEKDRIVVSVVYRSTEYGQISHGRNIRTPLPASTTRDS